MSVFMYVGLGTYTMCRHTYTTRLIAPTSVAACCSALHCADVCVYMHDLTISSMTVLESVLLCVAVCCYVLQRAAVCCSVLQCAAACCNVLHTAVASPLSMLQ